MSGLQNFLQSEVAPAEVEVPLMELLYFALTAAPA